MADPDVVADYARVLELAQERSGLEELVSAFRQYQELQEQLDDNRELLAESDDPELVPSLAELEIAELVEQVGGAGGRTATHAPAQRPQRRQERNCRDSGRRRRR